MSDNHTNDTSPHPPVAPWQRQPGETAKAFAAFAVYRDLPPAERSLDETCRRLAGKEKVAPGGHPNGTRRRRQRYGRVIFWCQEHHWVERSAAWDQEKDRLGLEAEAEAIKEMRRQHAAEAVQFRQRALAELAKIAAGAMTPAVVVRMFSEAVRIEVMSRVGNQPVPWQQGGVNNDRDFTLRTLQDPLAADLACQLLERLAGGTAQPRGPGVARQPGTVAGPAPPGVAQQKVG
jgi:hypothetical protein